MSVNVGRYVGLRRGKYWERAENSDYYCGGCGYPVTDHDSFCPECGGAFRECDASNLEEENAKLRSLCSRMALRYLPNDIRMTTEEWDKRNEQIADELQELEIEVQT